MLNSLIRKLCRVNPWESIYRLGVPADLVDPYEKLSEIIQHFKNSKVSKVLDVGMGNGRHVIPMIANGLEVYGFDLSATAVSFCKKIVSQKFDGYDIDRFVVADMFDNYPYKDNEFDAVIAIQSIYHGFESDMQKSIDEIGRVLKKDGKFVFTVSRNKDRSTVQIDGIISKAKGFVLKIKENTYLPLSGREFGLVHYYAPKEKMFEMLSRDFKDVVISEDIKNSYYLVVCTRK